MATLTIITPMFNARGTIGRTARSLARIAADHRRNVEWIVVDDGSTDGSVEAVTSVAAEIAPIDMRVIPAGHAGVSAARNVALQSARNQWVLFLDADDELLIDPVAEVASAGQATAVAWSVLYQRGGRARCVQPKPIGWPRWANTITAVNPFPMGSVMLLRERLTEPFDPDISFGEDWLFWARNRAVFERIIRRPAVASVRIHVRPDSASSDTHRAGAQRAEVAQRIEAVLGADITRLQRNNLTLQKRIGLLQQRRAVSPGSWFLLPCNPVLYGKLCVYALAALVGLRATPYR